MISSASSKSALLASSLLSVVGVSVVGASERRASARLLKIVLKPKKIFELSGSKNNARHKDKDGKFGKPDKVKKDALARCATCVREQTIRDGSLSEDRSILHSTCSVSTLV